MTLHISAESALALAMALNGVTTSSLEQRRAVAAEVVEDLIAFLDDTEGDCDLEALGDEQDASWPEQHMSRARIAGTLSEDDEDDDPAEECDPAESMLGAPECPVHAPAFGFLRDYPRYEAVRYPVGDQRHWSQGANGFGQDDCEDQNEDGGDVLDAPHDGFLGWVEDFTAEMDPVNCAHIADGELDHSDDEDADPEEDDGSHEYDLAFDFGQPRQSGEFDGPRDTEQKGQSDRCAASLFAAQAMRMARPRKVSA